MPTLTLPKVLHSTAIYGNNEPINRFKLTVVFTGSIIFFYGVSSSPTIPPASWVAVTGLESGVEKEVTLTGGGGYWLYYKVLLSPGAALRATKDSYGRFTAPAVRIRDIT